MNQHKGIHKLGLGTLSVFLSILMIVYLIPRSVYADLAPTIEGNEDTTTQAEQTKQITEESPAPDAMFELTERREQSVKHFRLSDGSIVAAQSCNRGRFSVTSISSHRRFCGAGRADKLMLFPHYNLPSEK